MTAIQSLFKEYEDLLLDKECFDYLHSCEGEQYQQEYILAKQLITDIFLLTGIHMEEIYKDHSLVVPSVNLIDMTDLPLTVKRIENSELLISDWISCFRVAFFRGAKSTKADTFFSTRYKRDFFISSATIVCNLSLIYKESMRELNLPVKQNPKDLQFRKLIVSHTAHIRKEQNLWPYKEP